MSAKPFHLLTDVKSVWNIVNTYHENEVLKANEIDPASNEVSVSQKKKMPNFGRNA